MHAFVNRETRSTGMKFIFRTLVKASVLAFLPLAGRIGGEVAAEAAVGAVYGFRRISLTRGGAVVL